jgi:hypothetical protein
MDPTQIERARQSRKIYLITFLINVIAGIGLRLTPSPAPVALVVGLGLAVALTIVTWRFCRALGIGTAWSATNAVLSPFISLFQLVVLLRIYAKRTRTGMTFVMGERVPSRT